MKVMFVCGSPRKNGNTDDVMRLVADKVAKRHDVALYHLADEPIHGCTGCYRCREDVDHPGCVQQDKVSRLLDKIIDADVVVYGSPLYGHSFSAEMNAFMNRHFALLKYLENEDPWARGESEIDSLVEDKEAGLIVTCQGPVENNAELLLMQFDRFCATLHLHPFGKYVFPWAPMDGEESDWDKDGIQRVIDDVDQIAEYL